MPARNKLHMQALAALALLDFNPSDASSHELAFLAIRKLDSEDARPAVSPAVFNIVGHNQGDHFENIAFLMDREAIDSSHPPMIFPISIIRRALGRTSARCRSTVARLLHARRSRGGLQCCGMPKRVIREVVGDVVRAVSRWRQVAEEVGVHPYFIRERRDNWPTFLRVRAHEGAAQLAHVYACTLSFLTTPGSRPS